MEGENVSNYYKYIPKHAPLPRKREWQPTPVFLPGELRGQRSLVVYSPWGCKESDTAERPTPHFTGQSGKLIFPQPTLGLPASFSISCPCFTSQLPGPLSTEPALRPLILFPNHRHCLRPFPWALSVPRLVFRWHPANECVCVPSERNSLRTGMLPLRGFPQCPESSRDLLMSAKGSIIPVSPIRLRIANTLAIPAGRRLGGNASALTPNSLHPTHLPGKPLPSTCSVSGSR